ncbi:MAG: twin transmembrane helix small protein [Gammaproteobacteria bacterium]|nr:MAG: twin transmembrane helix small protein [Gammaproteobacteria bacterium]
MIIKLIVLGLLVVIVGSLLSALVYLIRDRGQSDRTVKALTVRISLSILAFLLLMGGYFAGLVQPHGVLPVH